MIAYPLAVIIPVSALLGFVEAGNQVLELSAKNAGGSYSPSAEVIAKFQLYNTICMVCYRCLFGNRRHHAVGPKISTPFIEDGHFDPALSDRGYYQN